MSNKRHKYFNKVPPFKPYPEHYTRKQHSWNAKEAYETEDDAWEYLNQNPKHKAEVRMALELIIDTIADALKSGNTVTLPGVGTIGFSCRGAWTKTAEEQTEHKRKIGVAFYPSKDVLAAVAQAKTM